MNNKPGTKTQQWTSAQPKETREQRRLRIQQEEAALEQLEDSIFDCSSVSDIDGANMSHDNDGPNVTFRSES